MIKFDVKNRWSGKVQFTAEIDCKEGASVFVKLGLAAKWAIKSGAHLGGADLEGADLRGADLRGADLDGDYLEGDYLRGAYLRGAYLRGAYLDGDDLRGADLHGVDLGGLILIDRATRNDGYEYFAWTSVIGGKVIKAGCRTWVGEDAIDQARNHCMTETRTRNRAQALRIIGMIEAGYADHASQNHELEQAA